MAHTACQVMLPEGYVEAALDVIYMLFGEPSGHKDVIALLSSKIRELYDVQVIVRPDMSHGDLLKLEGWVKQYHGIKLNISLNRPEGVGWDREEWRLKLLSSNTAVLLPYENN